ncbi:MAG TPA: lactate racemase domain-containing protein [Chloroflexaceae bacterium]|nr:lactate racemase domain-containing protein [Chloroflexaceae bacterium]
MQPITINSDELRNDAPLPQMYRVRQRWSSAPVADIPGAVRAQLDGLALPVSPGMRVAVTAGSRGINDIVPVTRAAVAWLRAAGAEPFIVPAMGSHGGATAAGQVKMLASLGITEESVGCPIHSSMEVVQVGSIADGTPVFMDKFAAEADGVLVINRVKTHTSFDGPIESGLAKMCAVGLGKRQGAETVHRTAVYGLKQQMVPMARVIVERGKVLGGLAIIEDAREQTAEVVALPPDEIGRDGEARLLARSKELMARLPFERLDVLVVDELGKNISGTGMDTNVIGRLPIPGEPPMPSPIINVIVVLDLTEATHGNANGMGLADLTTARLAGKVDFHATYVNVLTAGLVGLCKGGLPIVLPTGHDAVATAIKVCGQADPADARVVRIKNTLLLEELLVSPALLPEVAAHPGLELLGPATWEGLD